MFAHGSKSCRNCRKVLKPRKLAYYECPQEIHKDYDDEDVVGDNGDARTLCCTKANLGLSMCDKCKWMYCTDCIDTHTCDM